MGIRSLRTASISTGTKRSKVWDQSAVLIPPNSYESIATQTFSSSASSVTFNSIPSTYKHLQIRFSANINAVAGANFRFNGDAGSNYRNIYFLGSGSTVTATGGGADTQVYGSVYGQGYDGGSSIFTAGVIDILDYADTNKNKVVRSIIGVDRNGSGAIQLLTGGWFNTAAINSISFVAESVNIGANSTVALYGIKG